MRKNKNNYINSKFDEEFKNVVEISLQAIKILENKAWRCFQMKLIGVSRLFRNYGIQSVFHENKIEISCQELINLYMAKKK